MLFKTGKGTLWRRKGKKFVHVKLNCYAGKVDQQPLDVTFVEGEEVSFLVKGKQ